MSLVSTIEITVALISDPVAEQTEKQPRENHIMPLKVIGTGFGRTGTNSLKLALEQLGFGPCHHMFEVRDHPEQLPFWQAAAKGDLPDWDEVFARYSASIDWPSARYWREITDYYPDAKVLHSIRPEESWINSFYKTIYPVMRDHNDHEPGIYRDRLDMAHETVLEQVFGGQAGNRAHALNTYRAHNEAVRMTIAPERLLVYDVAQGWGPLCQFLDVPVPDTPLPHVNSTRQFNQRNTVADGQ